MYRTLVFSAFAFRRDAWEVLRDALCEHGRRWEVKLITQTGFGVRYEVHGELDTPAGRRPVIWTVWQSDAGKTAPRLITTYPSEA